MKRFVAVYIGTPESRERARWDEMDAPAREAREKSGIEAWMKWGATHASAIVEQGGPLGKTKRVSRDGITDTRNAIAGYVVIEAESHEAAARLFEGHPHFSIFPGESVEIMECLPMPGR